SRLIETAAAIAAERGFRTLQGACFESDVAFPFAPVADVLRGYVAGRTPQGSADLLGTAAPVLLPLLPELVVRLPDLSPAPALAPEEAQRRIVHTVVQFLIDLAGQQPLLLVIEDLHWCDEASLEFLLMLARRIVDRPVLLLLTYRDNEA